MRTSIAILLWTLLGSSTVLLTARRPRTNDGLEALDAFRGEWDGSGEMYATPYSKAGPAGARTSCSWAPNHGFLVCDQRVHLGTKPENDLSIYTYDDSTHGYQFVGISRGHEGARTPHLAIAGHTWTYSSEFTDRAGHTVQFRTVNDVGDSAVTYRTEYSADGGTTWTVMGKGGMHRVR